MTYAPGMLASGSTLHAIAAKETAWQNEKDNVIYDERRWAYQSSLPVVLVYFCLPPQNTVLLYTIAFLECMFVWPSDAVAFAVSTIAVYSLKCVELLGWKTGLGRVWHIHTRLSAHIGRHVPIGRRLL